MVTAVGGGTLRDVPLDRRASWIDRRPDTGVVGLL
ncbi:hypothetical protein [Rubrobacter marinus]